MAASLDRLDALVFTGEIGEDQPEVREEICSALTALGVRGGLLVPELEDLNLNLTEVSDEALEYLKALPNLKWLSVHRTKVSRQGAASMKKSNPKLEVVR